MGAFDTDLVSPEGQIVTAKNANDLKLYNTMGYRPAQVDDIKQDEIRKVYDNWQGSVTAFGRGVMHGVPGLDTGITAIQNAVGDPGAAQDYAEESQTLSEVHPYIGGIGQMVGAAASAGMIGVGSGATTMAQVGTGVAGNVAMAAANTVDRAALAHSMSAGGEEKIMAHMGSDLLFAGILGAAFPVVGAGLSRFAKGMGGLSTALADSQVKKSLFDSQALDTIYQQGRATELGSVMDSYQLHDLTPAQATAKLSKALPQLTEDFEEMKAQTTDVRMKPMQGAQMVDQLGDMLGESHPKVAEKIQDMMLKANHAPNVVELSDMRDLIDSHITLSNTNPEAMAIQSKLMDARQLVGRNLRTALTDYDVATGGQLANSWGAVDRDYSAVKMVKDALRDAPAPSAKTPQMPWGIAYLSSQLGIPGIGKAAIAYKGASMMTQMFKNGQLAAPAKTLAGVFNASAERLTQATQAGLLGAAAAATDIMHKDAFTHEDYDIKAAQIRHGMKDPAATMTGMAKVATGHGLPDEMAQSAAMRGRAMQQYLYTLMPKNPDINYNGGTPSTFQPSKEMKQTWIDSYNTMNDPSHGLLNPTQQNLDILKKFYPDTLANVQSAVLQQIQSNHELPLESQTWATQIMGYPVGSLTSPQFYTLLTTARQINTQKDQQGAKQGGSAPSSGKAGQTGVSSNLTAVQKLQNQGM
jgi:hypothetical protein